MAWVPLVEQHVTDLECPSLPTFQTHWSQQLVLLAIISFAMK